MEYIKAIEKDIDAVYELVQDTIKTIYPKYYPAEVVDFFCEHHCKENIAKDIEDGRVGILIVENTMVGTGCYKDNHITRVYVKPEYQGRGYGNFIMQCLEADIAKNYDTVELDASLPASQIYEKRGYKTVKHERWNVENGVVLVYEIMGKPLESWKLEFVKCEKGMVYYWHTNIDFNKKTLFFLHGLAANHTMFEKQVKFFKDKYNVIVWDAPAHGKSRPYTGFSYENAVAEMMKILNELQIKEVVLIGQSMGGYVAQSFLARHPEMVIGFVSVDSTPFGNYYSKSDIWWLKQIEWMCKLFSEKILKVFMAKQNAITKAGRENMLQMVSDYDKEELCRLMGIGYAGFLDDNKELQISCPLLILVGEKDNTGKVKQYNEEWSKKTGVNLIWIPNAAHNSNVDNPEFVNGCIEEFLVKLK